MENAKVQCRQCARMGNRGCPQHDGGGCANPCEAFESWTEMFGREMAMIQREQRLTYGAAALLMGLAAVAAMLPKILG